MFARTLLAAATALVFAMPAAAQDFAITNATVATGDGSRVGWNSGLISVKTYQMAIRMAGRMTRQPTSRRRCSRRSTWW